MCLGKHMSARHCAIQASCKIPLLGLGGHAKSFETHVTRHANRNHAALSSRRAFIFDKFVRLYSKHTVACGNQLSAAVQLVKSEAMLGMRQTGQCQNAALVAAPEANSQKRCKLKLIE